MEGPLLAAALSAGAVALLCAVIAAAAWRAVVHTGNRAIYGVVAAFALLALKNLLKCATLAAGAQESAWHELSFSAVDLAAVALIAVPILRRGGMR